MKVALCLSGIASSGSVGRNPWRSTPSCYLFGLDSIKKNLIECNGGYDSVDVFIHSWNPELYKDLKLDYSPLSIVCENPIYPNFIYPHGEIEEIIEEERVQRLYSRWYSQKKSIELKREHEEKNNFEYDWVIYSRFDIEYLKPICLEKLNNKNFYVSAWQEDYDRGNSFGYSDGYFISNSKIMDEYCSLYDSLGEYLSPDSKILEKVSREDFRSSHVLSRYHLNNIGYGDTERFLGCEMLTWRIGGLEGDAWDIPWNPEIPYNLRKNKHDV